MQGLADQLIRALFHADPGAWPFTQLVYLGFMVAAGAETYVFFPKGILGGPVTITSSVPVIAAQRVQYFQSFNEVPAA